MQLKPYHYNQLKQQDIYLKTLNVPYCRVFEVVIPEYMAAKQIAGRIAMPSLHFSH